VSVRRLLRVGVLYAFHVLVARPVLHGLVGVRYRRRNRIPDGPCLVVANHNSHLDAAVLISMFPLRRLARVHPVAAADYFANWFRRVWAMVFLNSVPIERRRAGGRDPLAPIVELLKQGETLIFFPEGSRGEAGVVSAFRPGVGRLVREVPGLLVVPVFLSGTERIWPRGEIVPIPMGIEATIGRARAYPADEDARAIADRVRADVLALAPPLPPPPGPRPPPPTRVAVCSLDARFRHEAFVRITGRLGRLQRTLGVSDVSLEADASGTREVASPIPGGRVRLRLRCLSALFLGPRPHLGGDRFVGLVERARAGEALGHDRDVGFVVHDGCPLVELMALAATAVEPPFEERELNALLPYLMGHKRIPLGRWWRVLRRAPEIWLISVFGLARLQVPDVLVQLDAPIPDLLRRLRAEGRKLRPFETEPFLLRAQQGHRRVGALLRRRRIEALELDAAALDPEEIARRVEAVCAAHRQAPGQVAP
jgi:1-acyl-sn-glycerol-3-phosphate acyltransferase